MAYEQHYADAIRIQSCRAESLKKTPPKDTRMSIQLNRRRSSTAAGAISTWPVVATKGFDTFRWTLNSHLNLQLDFSWVTSKIRKRKRSDHFN